MLKKLPTNVLSGILALVVALAFFFWLFDADDPTVGLLPGETDQAPEWYWENARFWNFDKAGRLEQEATATLAEYYSAEDTIYLDNPRLISHVGNEDSWHTRAERGEVREKKDVVELLGSVEIFKGDGSVTIHTDKMTLIRSQDMAVTGAAVTISGATSRTDAIGMRAWLKQEKVELLAKVKTVHEPDN
jgi:lipopolysaccharide export system protein LptC